MDRHYRVLGLRRESATETEVKRAYRKKALLYHPDRNPAGGEAFKTLQDAYEAALADVKRGGGGSHPYPTNGGATSSGEGSGGTFSNYYHNYRTGGYREGGGGGGRSFAGAASFTTASSAASASATTAAGAAYNYARASAAAPDFSNSTPRGPPHARTSPPLFSEEELFGDAIPGGWRDVGSSHRNAHPPGEASTTATAAGPSATSSPQQGSSGTASRRGAAGPADARWRRAHGSRVPVSAYEGTCPVPPPPRTNGGRTSFSSVPPSTMDSAARNTTTTSTTTASRSAAASGSGPQRGGEFVSGTAKPSFTAGAPHQEHQHQHQPNDDASTTQAQWEAFLAQQHPWRRPPSPLQHNPTSGAAAANTSSEQDEEDGEESAEERAYREALYLHRRVQELNRKDTMTASSPLTSSLPSMQSGGQQQPQHPQPPSSSSATNAAGRKSSSSSSVSSEIRKKEALYRQWQDVQASLHRKMDRQDGQDGHAARPRENGGLKEGRREGKEVGGQPDTRSADTRTPSPPLSASLGSAAQEASGEFSPSRQPPSPPPQQQQSDSFSRPSFGIPHRQQHDNAHRDAMLSERRMLQREYLRYRYTPDPAEVGEMSDMEVYLLAEMLADVQGRVAAVLTARLTKGPCSCCGTQPRETTRLYFSCVHHSICAVCEATGVLSCPLCGAARVAASTVAGSEAAQP